MFLSQERNQKKIVWKNRANPLYYAQMKKKIYLIMIECALFKVAKKYLQEQKDLKKECKEDKQCKERGECEEDRKRHKRLIV